MRSLYLCPRLPRCVWTGRRAQILWDTVLPTNPYCGGFLLWFHSCPGLSWQEKGFSGPVERRALWSLIFGGALNGHLMAIHQQIVGRILFHLGAYQFGVEVRKHHTCLSSPTCPLFRVFLILLCALSQGSYLCLVEEKGGREDVSIISYPSV